MRFHHTSLPGLMLIEPEAIADERGFFVRVLSSDLFGAAGIDHARFVQENQSRSKRGTIRGLHVRTAPGETKLVRCCRGEVFDVVVDVRSGSPTFGRWESFILDDRRHHQLLIPAGFAHGFQAVSELTDVCYRHDRFYDPALEAAIAWDDPDLAIPWPLPDPILSDRDRTARRLREVSAELGGWFGPSAV